MADEEYIAEPSPKCEKEKWALGPDSLSIKGVEYVPDWYWAQEGDDLDKIAAKNGVSALELAQFNWGALSNLWRKQANYYLKYYCKCVLKGDRFVFLGKPCLGGIWVPVKKEVGKKTPKAAVPRTVKTPINTQACQKEGQTACKDRPEIPCQSHDKAKGITVTAQIGRRWPGLRDVVLDEFQETESWLVHLRRRAGRLSNNYSILEETLTLDLQAGLTLEGKQKRLRHLRSLPHVAVPVAPVSWDAREREVLLHPHEVEAVVAHLRILDQVRAIKNVVVRGYACNAGSYAFNKDLSKRRTEWVVNELEARFGLRFVAPVQVIAVGCGENFSRQPIPWDRVVVIEIEGKKAEKSKEAREVEEVFQKAEKSVTSSKRGDDEVTFYGAQAQYVWTYTQISTGNPSTADWRERTTLTYSHEKQVLHGLTEGDFEKIKNHAAKFLEVFDDFVVRAAPEVWEVSKDKLAMFKSWLSGLRYVQTGNPLPAGTDLTPADSALLAHVYDPLVPGATLRGGMRTICPYRRGAILDDKELQKLEQEPPYSLPQNAQIRQDIKAVRDTEFTSVGLDVDKQVKSRAAELAADFTHDLPPLILHFNYGRPKQEDLDWLAKRMTP